jgi:hypothetical protein
MEQRRLRRPAPPPRRSWPAPLIGLVVGLAAGGFGLLWYEHRPAERPAEQRAAPQTTASDNAATLSPQAAEPPANLVAAESPQLAFDQARSANTVQAWDEFLAKVEAGDVQAGPLVDQARRERAKLIAAQSTQPAFDEAKSANTVQAWDDFLAKVDSGEVQRGPLIDDARKERAKLVAAENTRLAFEQAKTTNTIEAWDDFLAKGNAGEAPLGPIAEQARRERAKLVIAQSPQAAFDVAKSAGTVEAWDEFLSKVAAGEIQGGPLAERARRERGILLTGQIQTELRRVGCDPGPPTSEWREGSRHALEAFNQNAGTSLDVSAPTPEALRAVQGQSTRVCSLVCGHGQKLEGDACVPISCDPGFAPGEGGICEKQEPLDQQPERQERQERPSHYERRPEHQHQHSQSQPKGKGKCMLFGKATAC